MKRKLGDDDELDEDDFKDRRHRKRVRISTETAQLAGYMVDIVGVSAEDAAKILGISARSTYYILK